MKLNQTSLHPNLRLLLESLKNPFVVTSLILGILGAPPLWYSGIFVGNGQEVWGGLLFLIWIIIYSLDALVTLTLLINTKH